MLEPGSKKKYDARMKPGKRQDVQDEFAEWVSDLKYEALLGSPAIKAYLFEAFVGGWGAKTRQVKRKRRSNGDKR